LAQVRQHKESQQYCLLRYPVFRILYSFFSYSSDVLLILGHNLAIKQMHCPLGVLSESVIVGYHADGGSALMKLGKQFHHGIAVLAVQVSRWLVGEQDGGGTDQRSGDRHTLLLTATQLVWVMPLAMTHPDTVERFQNPSFSLWPWHISPISER
jgi:hypothetical protein